MAVSAVNPSPRFLAAGDATLVVEFGEDINPIANRLVQTLGDAVAAAKLVGVVETVPTYRSLAIAFDPAATDSTTLEDAVVGLCAGLSTTGDFVAQHRRWFMPTAFGGGHGIDLDEVAARTGLTPAEVIARHCAADYTVYMLGFSPGFAYLGGLPDALHLPRRDSPRLSTPAGTVMQGGAQAAISPIVMPSGWHLLGQTPIRSFDLRRDDPFLLAPGDRVRFHAIDADRYAALAAEVARAPVLPDSEPVS